MWGKPLIHKRRGVARLALYLTPVLALALGWTATRFFGGPLTGTDVQWRGVDYAEIESVQLLQQLLRFDTTHPDGSEIPAAEFLARQLEAAGIPAQLERLGPQNANVWGILEGDDRQALVLHNHLDTDPVRQPEQWLHPPFSGRIDLPFIYGRGAFDMKSYAIAQLMSVLEIARGGRRPQRSLIFLATGQEEIDSRLGTRWILARHPELAERFAAVITEGGAVEAVSLDEVKYWGTEIGQKRFVDIWVCDAGRQRLEELRQSLTARQPEPRPPSEAVARFFRTYSGSRDHHVIRRLTENPEELLQDPEADFLPQHLMALLRNEIVAFPVEEDPEGGFRMLVVLHLLPDADVDEAWDELLPDGLAGFSFTVDVPHGRSQFSSTDHEVFKAIERVMAKRHPEVEHGPLIIPFSATDARFFRAAGIPSFGFAPFWILSAEANKMKGVNERLPLPSFVEGVELYVELVEHLVLGDAAGSG